MSVASKVREIYDRLPYPPVGNDRKSAMSWRLPSMEWISAMCDRPAGAPKRILVAGCGTGAEAFALRRRFARSTIVAADFSARSIALARQAQRRVSQRRRVRFVVADLTNANFAKKVGRNFDFISCHGVLSYLPQPQRGLRNLARCLSIDGALYLGVNGPAHLSVHWRPMLARFGFDIRHFEEGKRVREILKVCDTLAENSQRRTFKEPASYLASDVFGPLIHNWALERWVRLCAKQRLHFRGSYSLHRSIRAAFNDVSFRHLIPRSRAEMFALTEMLEPSAFQKLIFARRPERNPPWQQPAELFQWRARMTGLYRCELGKPGRAGKKLRTVRFKSEAINALVDLRVPEWEAELFRQSNGRRSIADVLAQINLTPPPETVRDQLYALYQLVVLNLSPPN